MNSISETNGSFTRVTHINGWELSVYMTSFVEFIDSKHSFLFAHESDQTDRQSDRRTNGLTDRQAMSVRHNRAGLY